MNTHIDEYDADSENFLDVDGKEEDTTGVGKLKDSLGGKDIVQLKSNHIPRGLIPLESLFDQNDIAKYPNVEPVEDAVENKNIGTEDNPKIIKLSKKLHAKENDDYMNLMKKYTDVFEWSYDDLKEYDTSIIQHMIPI